MKEPVPVVGSGASSPSSAMAEVTCAARAHRDTTKAATTAALVAALLAAWMAAGVPVLSFEVRGKVQGVFFRKHTQAEASRLGLRGWCENTKSGTVRGEAHGEAAALDKFKHWLRHTGSPKSKIAGADFAAVDKDPAALQLPFTIRK